jgi:uncharacterized protein with GYD domain
MMPTFLALFNWTEQGIYNVRETTKRAEKFKTDIQMAGGAVKNIFWTMGRYDGVIIFEAPDDATAAVVMMRGCSLGNVRTETLRAFTTDDMAEILEKIGS